MLAKAPALSAQQQLQQRTRGDMLALNCVNARARVAAEWELEEASKKVESTFIRMQVKEEETDQVALAIRDAKAARTAEMQRHLAWLLTQKSQLEQELADVDRSLAEKKLLLQERSSAAPQP